ncbi:MAG: transposase [Gemmatimonadaceae bacterium]
MRSPIVFNTAVSVLSAGLPSVESVLRLFVRRALFDEDQAAGMLAWPHSGFHVHTAVWVPEDDRAFATRLARSCARNPVALERLTSDRAAEAVTYRSDKSEGPTAGTETADPVGFLARILVHIPDKAAGAWPGARSPPATGVFVARAPGGATRGPQRQPPATTTARKPRSAGRRGHDRTQTARRGACRVVAHREVPRYTARPRLKLLSRPDE